MTETGELTRDDIVIDPDMDTDFDDGHTVQAYVETWFDVDKKFGTHTADEEETWVNFYAKYNTESGELKTQYRVSRPDGSDWHNYTPTEKEKQLILQMMEECCQDHHGCSLAEYVMDEEEMTMNGGIS